ncbi:MAG: hypothetical protein ACLFTB_00435 [Desulfovibrionales bacterium]
MKRATKQAVFRKTAALYSAMQEQYGQCAETIGLTCSGCADNCCTSFFQHHTYVEWAYLFKGLSMLPEERQRTILHRAKEYVSQARMVIAQGGRPKIMCPLNEAGLCSLYEYRLMICRLHGVPNLLRMPDGTRRDFPGCVRAQAITASRGAGVALDRTDLYRRLALIEMQLLGSRKGKLPRVNLTLAEMLVSGPPPV